MYKIYIFCVGEKIGIKTKKSNEQCPKILNNI